MGTACLYYTIHMLDLLAYNRSSEAVNSTVFLRSDAAATIYFAGRFVRLLFEGSYYSRAAFISLESPEKSTTGWIRYVRVRR